ncbi:MAG: ATP-binding cassette domain-containing protein [Culicoidibacterales bacterium]
MIKLQNICKTIPGSNGETRSLLENMNLTIQAGESCSIIGRSGCGKTTLIKILAGLETASFNL